MGKYQVRAMMRKLKSTGLKLMERKKVAKAILRDFGVEDTLGGLGFKTTQVVPCCDEYCDSRAHVTWERDGKTLRTNFGVLDIPKPSVLHPITEATMCTSGKVMVKVEGKVGDRKLVLTDTEGETYTFKHDPRLSGDGLIHAINGNLNSLLGTSLRPTTLKSDDEGYAWCFYTQGGELLAEVRWLGVAGGYYGEDYDEENLALI